MKRIALALVALLTLMVGQARAADTADWPFIGGDIGGQRYSPLGEITKANVGKLRVAWTYHTGDFSLGGPDKSTTAFEAAPIEVGGTLYLCSPNDRVIALDPETGKEKWKYLPTVNQAGVYEAVCRGVTYWKDASAQAGATCAERIFVGTIDARLIALDAKDGKPCADFGQAGTVDMKQASAMSCPANII